MVDRRADLVLLSGARLSLSADGFAADLLCSGAWLTTAAGGHHGDTANRISDNVGRVFRCASVGSSDTATAKAATVSNGKPQAMSYYCEKSKGYYPNVGTCEGGWVATPVKPPN